MPLKLKLPGLGDSGKRTKTSQSNSTKTSSNHSSDRKYTPSKSQRHHSADVESVSETPPGEDYSPVFAGGGGNNNFSPVSSPQSVPESWGTPPKYEQRRRPKSVSAPTQPEDVGIRTKDTKPGRNRAYSVSRSGKFKEANKRRTSLLEIQDRFDKAKGSCEDLGSPGAQNNS